MPRAAGRLAHRREVIATQAAFIKGKALFDVSTGDERLVRIWRVGHGGLLARAPKSEASRLAPYAAAIRRSSSFEWKEVRHIARLARIAMSDEELERLVPELNNILGWVEQLGEVDTDGIELRPANLRLREDIVTDGEYPCGYPRKCAGMLAETGFFVSPKVIE